MKLLEIFIKNYTNTIVLVFITVLYLLTLRGIPGTPIPNQTPHVNFTVPPFETSMERGRYAQILAIALHQTFTVDAYANFLNPDLAWYNGHYYSAFPPGTALLSVPAFFIGYHIGLGQVFAYSVSLFISILTGIVLLETAKKWV